MMAVEQTQASNLTDHLEELRDRVIKCAWAVVICTLIAWLFNEQIFEVVRAPIMPYLAKGFGGLVFTNPMDKFIAHIKLSVLAGVILACPIWLYQLWMFVAPGLYSHERKYTAAFILSGTALFVSGVLFVYKLVFPAAFHFLLNFGGDVDKPMITIDEYLSFFITTTVVFGLAFELPLIITLLGVIGVVDEKFLRKNRRYAFVVIAIAAAIITPPDMLSMLMLLGPMALLYEVSVLIVATVNSKRAVRHQP